MLPEVDDVVLPEVDDELDTIHEAVVIVAPPTHLGFPLTQAGEKLF